MAFAAAGPSGSCTMLCRRNLLSIAFVALGAVLGYAAAAGHLSFNRTAAAAPPAPATAATPPAAHAPCCSDGAPAGLHLVGAGQKDAPKDGKKPNILVIMGDDI